MLFHRRTISALLICCACIGLVVFVAPAHASDVNFGLTNVDTSIGLSNERSVIEIITGIIRIMLGLLGIIVLGLIVYAGFLWMTSNGNEQQIDTAKRILTNAVIGLAIILSAFAITSFLINRLSEATDANGTNTNNTSINDCAAGQSCTLCTLYPENSACLNQTFFVKSITPSTDGEDNDDATYMNNVRVQVVFSRPVANAMYDTAYTVRDPDGDLIPGHMDVFEQGRLLVFDPDDSDYVWAIGEYEVEVAANLEDYQGGDLKTQDVQGTSRPRKTQFYINQASDTDVDEQDPLLTLFEINGEASPGPQYIGQLLKIDIAADDRVSPPPSKTHVLGGIGYMTITVREGTRIIYKERTGPRVRTNNGEFGSSPTFETDYKQTITASDFTENAVHTVEVTVVDIAGNMYTETKDFIVYRPECNNNILDPGELSIDSGGVCGGLAGDECTTDAHCSPYMQCISGYCVANPVITDFDPNNAAADNWVTVFGRYFGADVGTVELGYPDGSGGQTWVPVFAPSAAQCPSGDLWNSSWTIIEVPDTIANRDDVAIRLTRAVTEDEPTPPSDSTLDTRGTTDLFSKDDTERPGLCTVLNQETPIPQGAPRDPVTAIGRGFESGVSQIFWGSRQGQVTAYTTAGLLNSIVPEEFGNGVVGVRIDNGGGAVSNGIPFTVRTEQSNSDPLISYIDPAETTIDSYITIFGNNFGVPYGQVFLSDSAAHASACASGNASADVTCYLLRTELPDRCGVTWSGDEVVVQVRDTGTSPADIPAGTYHIVLRTVEGRQTSGVDQFTIVDGPAKPSICKITPNSGPAPLPNGQLLTIIGDNFVVDAPTNFVLNGSFEDYFNSWTHVNAIPLSGVTDAVGTAAIYTGEAFSYSGERSVGVSRYAGESTAAYIGQSFGNLDSSTVYRLSFFAKRMYPDRPASIRVQAISGAAIIKTVTVDIAEDWTPVTVEVSPAVGTGIVALIARVQNAVADGDPPHGVYIDEVRLIDVSTSQATVRFWDTGSNKQTIDTGWLIADDGSIDGTTEISLYEETQIKTIFPLKQNGLSVPTGEPVPIKVRNENGQQSNGVTYEVNVCNPATVGPGLRCCTTGPEAGKTVPDSYTCPGETRTAGYTWRISSGIIPEIPYVLEQCNQSPPPFPSPSPSDLWNSGESVCVNALVGVEFSLAMDPNSITDDNIRMFKCTTGKRRGCEEVNLAAGIDQTDLTDNKILQIYNGGDTALEANTWYTVEIDQAVRSFKVENVAGRDVEFRRNLNPTRPCGGDTAYCFDFKTSAYGEVCTMVDAFIIPSKKTIRDLGPVEDYPGYRTRFQVLGESNQECVVISARDIDWDWTLWNDLGSTPEQQIANNLVENGEVEIDQVYQSWKDVRTLLALQEVLPQPMQLRASTTVEETITGTSEVTIALGDPEVSTYWPNCSAACSNATIGVMFNRTMLESTFVIENVQLYACDTRTCPIGETGTEPITFSIPAGSIHQKGFEIVPDEPLERDTWYRVVLTDGILSIGGYNKNESGAPVALPGDAIAPFTWGFKTKANFDGCFVESVELDPNGYLARFVGEKNIFGAIPFGTPDECSPYGQRLNPFAYDWDWSIPLTADQQVVSITSERVSPYSAPGCTENCTLVGSDIRRTEDVTAGYLCGNGSIDPGENCDIGMTGEVAGVNGQTAPYTCTYSCQRPGNGGESCGNGILDNPVNDILGAQDFGEECDDGNKMDGDGCSATCVFEGSNASFTGDLAASYCSISEGVLDGELDPGEECEISTDGTLKYRPYGDAVYTVTGLKTPRSFCTDRCLMKGTALAQSWCDVGDRNVTVASCTSATSYCGNNVVESGEACEIISDDGTTAVVRVLTDNPDNVTETTEISIPSDVVDTVCTATCLLGDLCDYRVAFESSLASSLRCDPENEEGCTNQCTHAGSSLAYTNLSICRDGVADTGEYAICEEGPRSSDLFASPYQVATALGLSTVLDETSSQVSAIRARVDRSFDLEGALVNAPTGDNAIYADAPYYLQCGFVEYDIPSPIENSTVTPERTELEYNGCGDATGNGGYELGVAYNSCCYPRPATEEFYPAHLSSEVCRNTLMEVVYDGGDVGAFIDKASVRDNVIIARQITTGTGGDAANCAALGLEDVTALVHLTFANSNPSMPNGILSSIFHAIWDTVVAWLEKVFNMIFGTDTAGAYGTAAIDFDAANTAWCNTSIEAKIDVVYEPSVDLTTGNSIIRVSVRELLAEDRPHALLLLGGPDGIHDDIGVPIQPRHNATVFEGVAFTTGDEICKITDIDVLPEQHLFTEAFQDKDTYIDTLTAAGERVVPIPGVYDWEYSWAPQTSDLFIIPVLEEDESQLDGDVLVYSPDSAVTSLASRDIEAQQSALGRVIVTDDFATETGDTTGRVFTDTIDLYARFCANPWGAHLTTDPPTVMWEPYRNDRFNFEFWYCADARSPRITTDDLPLFTELVVTEPREDEINPTDDIIERTFFFNTGGVTDDAFGVQVFLNRDRLSARDWFVDHFGTQPTGYQVTTVDGYDAITNGSTYYVNALNVAYEDGTGPAPVISDIFSNIYQFSINDGATEDTQAVFADIMDNLVFNTNVSDWGYCLNDTAAYGRRDSREDFNDEVACSSDFDCLDILGANKAGTNGICSNNRTTLFRDIDRMSDISFIQQQLEAYRSQQLDNTFPTLAAGTFSPSYTVSRWGSWGNFLGTPLPTDPLNDWTQCGDPTTTNQQVCYNDALTEFFCPAAMSVYEYTVADDARLYTIHGNLEFLEMSDPIVSDLIRNPSLFVDGPSCTAGQIYSSTAGECGNGIINTDEDCDPPGEQVVQECNSGGGSTSGLQAQVCQADCTYALNWSDVACTPKYECGNGIVEGGEECDAGGLNGSYGSGCTASCTFGGGYCGNNTFDYVDTNGNGQPNLGDTFHEFCDSDGGVCVNIFDGVPVSPVFYLLMDRSGSMNIKLHPPNDPEDNRTRWEVVTDAMDNVLSQLKNSTEIGVGYFSGKPDDPWTLDIDEFNPDAGSVIVQTPVILTDMIVDNLVDSLPDNPDLTGYTYLLHAIEKHIETEDVFAVAGTRPKILVLLVDGDATDGVDAVTDKLEDMRLSENIYTYVIAAGVNNANFDTWAEAGGTIASIPAFSQEQLEARINSIVGCSEYALEEKNSCSASCQGYGDYCGDGIVQELYEECDDGNIVAGDGCNSICKIDSGTPPPPPGADNTGTCGDGLVQTPNINGITEICDLGASNGIAPAAVYGETQSYCSSDCRTWLTIDSAGYCGDGEVQPEEACDASGDTVFGPGGALVCADRGAHACTNSCQTLVDNCVSCTMEGYVDDLQRSLEGPRAEMGAIPQLAVLNPLIAGNDAYRSNAQSGFASGGETVTYWGEWPKTSDNKQQDSNINGTDVTFYRYGQNNSGTTVNEYLGFHGITDQRIGPVASPGYPDNTQRALVMKQPWEFGYLDFAQPPKPGAVSESSGHFTRQFDTLETDLACRDQYSFVFNARMVNRATHASALPDQTGWNGASTILEAIEDHRYSRFPFPVNGETDRVRNTVIASPALPKKAVRIVIKWSGLPTGVAVSGNLYNQAFSGSQRVSYELATEDDNHCNNMELRDFSDREPDTTIANKVFTNFDPMNDDMINPDFLTQYWWPKTSGSHSCSGYGTTNDDAVFVHDIGTNENNTVHIQSMTIDVSEIDGGTDGKVIPFFVTGIGATMQQLQQADITVEVYRYHVDQVPGYSFYLPDFEFHIDQAEKSSNSDAPYWHVFNLYVTSAEDPGIMNYNENQLWNMAIPEAHYINPEAVPWADQSHGKILTRYCTIREISEKLTPGTLCEVL